MTETREQILEEIKIQGDLVRKLKAAKETKEKVSSRQLFSRDSNHIGVLFVVIFLLLNPYLSQIV